VTVRDAKPTPITKTRLVAAGFADESGLWFTRPLPDGTELCVTLLPRGRVAATLTAHPELDRGPDDCSGEVALPDPPDWPALERLCRALGVGLDGPAAGRGEGGR
jgi:hypothetical protein